MEKTRRVNLAAANSFHGDKLIRLSANVLVQTWLRANTTSTFLYIYIYIDVISTVDAFNRGDISSFGFHGRVEIADRRGGRGENTSRQKEGTQVIGLEKSIGQLL